jgi:cellulose synthase/poly-beta-1,6-N-acetylglucosamine synthase-like glycosyltransferase
MGGGRSPVRPEVEPDQGAQHGATPGPSTALARVRISCSVGVMAHDEEANIGRLLAALVSQRSALADVREVIVIASGCTDRTEAIVRAAAERDRRILLLVEPRRQGKASAVNLFLSHAREHVLVLCSADLLPRPDTLDLLLEPFSDPELGMTTCRPVPVNDPGTFLGFAAHLLWNLHHEVNQRTFKAGEMIAFRKAFQQIPYQTSVDEASIEPVIRGQGYKVRYVGSALVFNKGPETARDFLRQRRRIYAGHLALRHEVGYNVATVSGLRVLGLMLRTMPWRPRPFVWSWAVAALEAYGRYLGRRDYRLRRDHSVWAVARTTKALSTGAAPAEAGAP